MILLAACSSSGGNDVVSGTMSPNGVETVRYSSNYGPGVMDVWRAPDRDVNATHPALFFLHGGGWATGSRRELDDVARAAATHGFTVFNIDYRLDRPGPDQVDNVRGAISIVLSSPRRFGVDGARIGVLGSSAGATLGALVGLESGSRIRAVVGWSGAYDFSVADENAYQSGIVVAASTFVGCDLRDSACRASRGAVASPSNHVGPGAPAMYLVNSTTEIVPTEQLWLMSEAMRRARRPVETTMLTGNRHASEYANDAIGPSLSFLHRVLGS